MKKWFSFMLATVMLLAMLPLSLVASAQEYIPLNYGEDVKVSIVEGQSTWYQITATRNTYYTFYSYDNEVVDPVAALYDSSMELLENSDDYSDRNFRLSYELTAGETYYLEVYDYHKDEEGSFMLCVDIIEPTNIKFLHSSVKVFSGTQYDLEAYTTIEPLGADRTLTWTSSDESIATVEENGVVTFLKGGLVTITVETSNLLTASCEFNVAQVADSIELGETKEIVVTEDAATKEMYITFTPEETGNYRLRSFDIVSDPSTEKIDPKAVAYDQEFDQLGSDDDTDEANFWLDVPMEAGTTYYYHVSLYQEEAMGSYKLTVEKPIAASSIMIDCGDLTMKPGEYFTLTASYEPEGCWKEGYDFTSSDESVVEVAGRRIYAVAGGEAVITVTSEESELTDFIVVTVEDVTTLELDTTYTVEDAAGEGSTCPRFAFTPTESGLYTIVSDEAIGEDAVVSVLLKGKEATLRSSDAGRSSFRLTHELIAGEHYYYDVMLADGGADSSVEFMLTQEDLTAIPRADVNTDYVIDIADPGNGVYFVFKPTMTGEYKIFSSTDDKEVDPKLVVLSNDWKLYTADDDSAQDDYNNFLLSETFYAGRTYYLKNISYHNSVVGQYTMRIEPQFELATEATVTGSVSGVEEDTHVVIQLIADGFTEPAYEVTVDGNGEYTIENVPLATYTFKVTADGYNPVTDTVIVDGDTTVDFEMAVYKPTYAVYFYFDETDEWPIFGIDVEEGETVGEPAEPGKEGKIFIGWYLDGAPYDFSTPVTQDLKLVAMFEDITTTLPGDMNGDGVLNTMDALLLYSGVSGGTLTDDQQAIADYNGDSMVNMMDALLLYTSVSGM